MYVASHRCCSCCCMCQRCQALDNRTVSRADAAVPASDGAGSRTRAARRRRLRPPGACIAAPALALPHAPCRACGVMALLGWLRGNSNDDDGDLLDLDLEVVLQTDRPSCGQVHSMVHVGFVRGSRLALTGQMQGGGNSAGADECVDPAGGLGASRQGFQPVQSHHDTSTSRLLTQLKDRGEMRKAGLRNPKCKSRASMACACARICTCKTVQSVVSAASEAHGHGWRTR